ncbi:group III truncated hemoglobin [Diaphorobacter ruginosibacter]|uniref:group III truncated hemoglobin n=1 Tax=Diaphorobacter ruginosibacter TaxID=1715720 RepID=UPI00333F9030
MPQASSIDAPAEPENDSGSPPEPLTPDSIAKLVRSFYGDVLAHPLLGPVFRAEIGEHWDAHLQRMVDFWMTVMLGSKCFRGNLVHRHMQLRDVTPAHFNAWIQLWTLHTADRFDSSTTYKLRRVAHDIGRQLFASYFDKERKPDARDRDLETH